MSQTSSQTQSQTPPRLASTLPARTRGLSLSTALHILVLLAITGLLHRGPRLAPYKLPGTSQGQRLLTYYSPGSPQQAPASTLPQHTPARPTPAPVTHALAAPPTPVQPPAADRGLGSSAESGLGDGDISIATVKNFSHPAPDLSSLPHGARGDVILNAVIDEHGAIKELTLVKGLGAPIDDAVMATVRQWYYAPATKDGIPIPSEQELLFHYERS